MPISAEDQARIARIRAYARALIVWGPTNPLSPPVQVGAAGFLNDIADEMEGLPLRRPNLFDAVGDDPAALIARVDRLEEVLARMIDEYRHRWGERAVVWAIAKLNEARVDGRSEPFNLTTAWEPTQRELARIASRLGVSLEMARVAYDKGMREPAGEGEKSTVTGP